MNLVKHIVVASPLLTDRQIPCKLHIIIVRDHQATEIHSPFFRILKYFNFITISLFYFL